MHNSVELWRGPSRINGDPIVVLMSGLKRPSANKKTGDMLQVFILPQDTEPHRAHTTDAGASVCGDCPRRPQNAKAAGLLDCYVVVGKSVLSIWRAWKRGNVPAYAASRDNVSGRKVRIGAYGDPCAAPVTIWKYLARKADGVTGYSHQWMHPRNASYKRYLMASTENDLGTREANYLGWRAFQAYDEIPTVSATECPSARGINCADCLGCSGTFGRSTGNRAIAEHR